MDDQDFRSTEDGGAGGAKPSRTVARKSASFKRAGPVLSALMSRLGLDRRLREHTLAALWPILVGDPFAQRSRPLYFDAEGKLVITVSDAPTAHELTMLKTNLTAKLKSAARPLGVGLTGLRFTLKNFEGRQAEEPMAASPNRYPEPDRRALDAICLTEEENNSVADLLGKLKQDAPVSPISAERMASAFERELRRQSFMRQAGYPKCGTCATLSPRLHGAKGQCAFCAQDSLQPRNSRDGNL